MCKTECEPVKVLSDPSATMHTELHGLQYFVEKLFRSISAMLESPAHKQAPRQTTWQGLQESLPHCWGHCHSTSPAFSVCKVSFSLFQTSLTTNHRPNRAKSWHEMGRDAAPQAQAPSMKSSNLEGDWGIKKKEKEWRWQEKSPQRLLRAGG